MIESKEHKQDLIKFAEKLRYKSQSFPMDEDGKPTEKYLEYVSMMYNADIVKIALEIDVFPEMTSSSKLARKLSMDKKELLKKLEPVTERGFIIKMGPRLSLPMPLFVYDMPFILERNLKRDETKEMARLSREFFEDGYYKLWETSRKGVPRTRVLTVSEEIEDPKEIVPIEEVSKILDNFEDFALIGCPCRVRKDVEGIRVCKDKYPVRNCIILGPNAKALIEMGDPNIEIITKEEAIRISNEAAKLGLVHTTDNRAENVNILCACCECCCGLLAGLTRLDNPRSIAKANYISTIDPDLCIGCETCLGRCKFGAISIDTIAKITVDKCIGCGLCAVTCPEKAITMKRVEREIIPGI